MKLYLPCFFIIVLICSCNNETTDQYASDGLRKLEGDEIIDRIKNNALYNSEIVFKDQQGRTISRDTLEYIDENLVFADYYVDAAGTVKEVILRAMRVEDRDIIEQIRKAEAEVRESLGN